MGTVNKHIVTLLLSEQLQSQCPYVNHTLATHTLSIACSGKHSITPPGELQYQGKLAADGGSGGAVQNYE